MSFKVENHTLQIDLDDIFSRMSEEAQNEFIHSMAIQKNIIEKVVSYICGEDSFGAWTSEEPELRQRLLERVEKAHIENLSTHGPRYGWRVWSDIQQKLKDIACKKHVYWALAHDEVFSEKYGWDVVHKFFKRHSIESSYTTKEADEDIKRVENLIKVAMSELLAKKVEI